MRIIGIDPGKYCGFAYVESSKIMLLQILTYQEVIDRILTYKDVVYSIKASKTVEFKFIVQFLCRHGKDHKVDILKDKINAETFKKTTSYRKSTNQHTRNAAMMALNSLFNRISIEKQALDEERGSNRIDCLLERSF